MKVDALVSWPKNNDYPLWRQMIHQNRNRFEKVIVVFTETYSGHDYREFVIEAMKNDTVEFVQSLPPTGDNDWRDMSVNIGLNRVVSEWVWFTEQDFFPSPQFWDEVAEVENTFKVLTIKEGSRLHPACIFVPMDLVLKTRRRFGIIVDLHDHFFNFFTDLKLLTSSFFILDSERYRHMNGLSHNWSLLESGGEITYKPEEFTGYLLDCLQIKDVPLNEQFIGTAQRWLSKHQADYV